MLALSILLVSIAGATLREELAPFLDLGPSDSVVALRRIDSTTIRVELLHGTTRVSRDLAVSSAFRGRILAAARSSDLAESASAPPPPGVDEQARNRAMFNRIQGSMGAGVLYWTVGFGLQPSTPSTATGLVLLGYPASYFGHFLYSREREWTDAHLAASNYVSTDLWLTTLLALPFLTKPDGSDAWRLSTFAAAAAYPVGLHAGYLYGEKRRNDPGRVYLAQSLAAQGALTGALVLPALLADDDMGENNARTMLRYGALAAVGGEVGGHVLAENLFAGETVPGGLGLGVSTLANLGLATALGVVMDDDMDGDFHLTLGAPLVGNTIGTIAALKLLPGRRDTRERSLYIGAGTSLGAIGGTGLLMLSGPDETWSARQIYAWPLLGAWAGYGIATYLTRDLVEAPSRRASSGRGLIGDVAFCPVVVPGGSGRDARWTWPGMTISLR